MSTSIAGRRIAGSCFQLTSFLGAAAILAVLATPGWALDQTKGAAGANHAQAHSAPHQSTGADATFGKVGIIEAIDGVDVTKTDIDDDGRLISHLKFNGLFPGFIGPPPVASTFDSHGTLVSEIIGSSDATYTGVAPGANLYVGTINTDPSIKYGIDYFYRNNGVALFNMSLGGPRRTLVDDAAHTGAEVTLNAANSTGSITTFDFGAATVLPASLQEIRIVLNLEDGDTGVGNFDAGNLILRLDGTDIPGVVLNDFKDGLVGRREFRAPITAAQSTAILASLGGNTNQITASIKRLADLADTDSGDNSGNRVTPLDFDFGDGVTNAEMRLIHHKPDGDDDLSMFMDWHINKFDTLIVKSAGNEGETTGFITDPGAFYNGITVGAADLTGRRADFSSWKLDGDDGTARDGRAKPEIMAPGVAVEGRHVGIGPEDGTSFAAPHVTGVAALLQAGTTANPAGLPMGQSGRNHLAVKAIILNSARKRFISTPENSVTSSFDHAATANGDSDYDYLMPNGQLRNSEGPKTDAWTPSFWSSDGKLLTVTRPLDDEQGTGMLDAERALIQYDAGQQFRDPFNGDPLDGGGIKSLGYALGAISSGIDTYTFGVPIAQYSFLTATLAWDRIINEVNVGGGMVGQLDNGDTYSLGSLPALWLQIFHKDELLATSFSAVGDNLAHLHYPVPYAGSPGDYSIQVNWVSGVDVNYGLAWWSVVPEPSAVILLLFGLISIMLSARRRELHSY